MPTALDTPARLIAAAEQLFIEGGEAATSLRAIARAAHANAAAVHYHFGGRDQLMRAVYERHLSPVLERRLRRLDSLASPLDSAGTDDTDRQSEPGGLVAEAAPRARVAMLVEAAVRPDLELLAKLRRHRVEVARFLGRARSNPTIAAVSAEHDQLTADRLVPLLKAALPGVGEGDLRLRLRLVGVIVTALFADAPGPGEPGPLGTDDVDQQVARLIAFAAAGLSAAGAGAVGEAIDVDAASAGGGPRRVPVGRAERKRKKH